MSFWADKLSQSGPGVPPPAPPPAPSGAWWAPQSLAQPQAGLQEQAPGPPAAYVPVKPPPHLKQASGLCPECGSDSYFEIDPKQGPRCYACGATSGNRTRNSTQGTAVVSQRSGPTRAARQVTGPGYRPDIIVGSI